MASRLQATWACLSGTYVYIAVILLKQLSDSLCMAWRDREPICGFHTFCDFPLTALGFISKAKNKLMKFINNILHQNNTMTKLTCPKSKQRIFLSSFYVCSFLIGQYRHVKKYPRICFPWQIYLLSNSFFLFRFLFYI